MTAGIGGGRSTLELVILLLQLPSISPSRRKPRGRLKSVLMFWICMIFITKKKEKYNS
jgi:hypothetical protein